MCQDYVSVDTETLENVRLGSVTPVAEGTPVSKEQFQDSTGMNARETRKEGTGTQSLRLQCEVRKTKQNSQT